MEVGGRPSLALLEAVIALARAREPTLKAQRRGEKESDFSVTPARKRNCRIKSLGFLRNH